MEVTNIRKPASFRLRSELLEELKVNAKRCNRSLNNYVESLLLAAMENEPNDTTKAAMSEAEYQARAIKAGQIDIQPVDTSSVDAMLTSIGV